MIEVVVNQVTHLPIYLTAKTYSPRNGARRCGTLPQRVNCDIVRAMDISAAIVIIYDYIYIKGFLIIHYSTYYPDDFRFTLYLYVNLHVINVRPIRKMLLHDTILQYYVIKDIKHYHHHHHRHNVVTVFLISCHKYRVFSSIRYL